MRTVIYVGIGNSDDKLTQAEWSRFVKDTETILSGMVSLQGMWYGNWRSQPDDPWQNACWCLQVDLHPLILRTYQVTLARLAEHYRQDSISWAEVPETLFLGPDWLKRQEAEDVD